MDEGVSEGAGGACCSCVTRSRSSRTCCWSSALVIIDLSSQACRCRLSEVGETELKQSGRSGRCVGAAIKTVTMRGHVDVAERRVGTTTRLRGLDQWVVGFSGTEG